MDVQARELRHQSGKGAKYTRSRVPVRMVYHEEYATLSEARRREAEVKKWPKKRKEELISPQIASSGNRDSQETSLCIPQDAL